MESKVPSTFTNLLTKEIEMKPTMLIKREAPTSPSHLESDDGTIQMKYDSDEEVKEFHSRPTGNPGIKIDSDAKYRQCLQPHFVWYIVGKPGSGKTGLLIKLITGQNYFFKKFNKVFLFSPYTIEGLPCDENKNWFNTLTVENLERIIAAVVEFKPNANILIIIDDQILQLRKLQNDPDFLKFFYNRRKLIPKGTISFIITGQKYITFPPSIRSILTGLVHYRIIGCLLYTSPSPRDH
jgi:hypothetical protein